MKIILSKKGLDSNCSNKGIAFHKEGKMPFVPIPSNNDICVYNEYMINHLQKGCKLNYTIDGNLLNQFINVNCHLDPQLIDYFENTDAKKFKASFGQVDGPQATLSKAGVGIGDIFLFYGWYYDDDMKQNQNIIFGYMQIGAIIETTIDKDNVKIKTEQNPNFVRKTRGKIIEDYPFIKKNPHWNYEKYKNKTNNTIYIAKDKCDFDKNINGFGLFNYSEDLVLTEKPSNGKVPTKTQWLIKGLEGKGTIEFKNIKEKLENGKGQIVKGFGQEFIFKEENEKIEDWAINLIKKHGNKI